MWRRAVSRDITRVLSRYCAGPRACVYTKAFKLKRFQTELKFAAELKRFHTLHKLLKKKTIYSYLHSRYNIVIMGEVFYKKNKKALKLRQFRLYNIIGLNEIGTISLRAIARANLC